MPRLQQYLVAEVYGRVPMDFVGGDQPGYMGTPLSRGQLREYVAVLDKHGIAFNYLLNSSCLQETGGWKWPAFMLVYTNVLAYMACLMLYQGVSLVLGR